MKRKFLYKFYETPKGLLFRQQEVDFLQRSITVSYKQSILQIGALGWENQYIDSALYKYYVIIDAKGGGSSESRKIRAVVEWLPIKTDSVDMIILPHVLEFVSDQHHVLREIARILKPEGKLIILNFNPWRLYVHYQYLRAREKYDPWRGLFLTQAKIIDWLKLLNFDVEVAGWFNFDQTRMSAPCTNNERKMFMPIAYAVIAIKRRYNIIPLTPVKEVSPQLVMAGGIESAKRIKQL